ncbi:SusC/RagA family TonB-linked outer membrane protein [Tellurirhabdus rosea]|uniref:SusC/RagA family TonB-linked outer membrane protein n=1 Tax=Tellurirhabdus rosea TaxID=2674997 RepID=UPI0022514E5F|nr:TonB-dependent receptor [Tellurirhabdus rosea]
MKQPLRFLFFLLTLVAITTGYAQERKVSGRVTSADDGAPLPGVSIAIQGGTRGAQSDAQGNYSLSVPDSKAVLVFSFVGMVKQEITVGNQSVINVDLKSDASQLNEVVVTGYGQGNRREFAGSVASISPAQIKNQPVASFDQLLQGQAPGVLVIANSGQPGAAASVRVRGSGSVNGSNTPLYIVDGIQIDAAAFQTINPQDIETISVLKDADATAIYGSRGANGVIVIKTRQGKAGKTRISYDGQYGQSYFPQNRLELMNTNEKIDYELRRGGTDLAKYTAAQIADLRKVNTDWQKEIFQIGQTQQHQLSASGGNESVLFYVSGNMFSQTGTVKGTDLNRYTGRMNLEANSGPLRFGLNATVGYSIQNFQTEGNTTITSPLNAIRWANPYETPYNADGTYTAFRSGQPNPVRELNETSRQFNELKTVAAGFLEYDFPFLKGLSVRTNWGVDFSNQEQTVYNSRFGQVGTGSAVKGRQGRLSRDFYKNTRFTGTTSLNYNNTFGDHSVRVGLYTEMVRLKLGSFGYTGYGLGGILQNEAGITQNNANMIPDTRGDGIQNALVSYFTTLGYGFKNRYYLNVNLRRDGSSRFGKSYRFADFGSVGASWVISDEPFMQGITSGVLNNLRLKASYGSVGNQEGIGSFASLAIYQARGGRTSQTISSYDGSSTVILTQLENPELRWEQKNTFNAGVEFSLLSKRISGGVEVYNSVTKNLFLNDQLSRTTGFNSINRNIGELQNRGIEIGLNTVNVDAGDFSWETNINFTLNRNKILKLTPTTPERGIISGNTINRVGQPINSNWLVEYAGVNPQTGAQQFRNLKGEITETYSPNDAQIFGPREAPYFGGVTNTLRFKGIEVSALFTYAFGNYIFNNDRTNVENPNYYADNVSRALLREWQKAGDITDIPNPNLPYQTAVTHFLEKGDFLRLRNLTVSYNLPGTLMRKAKMSSARIFVQGQNMLTFTKFQGFDPEITGGQLTGAQYPALRTFTAGLGIGF